MTIEEAKHAVESGAVVIYSTQGRECEWRAVAIVSKVIREFHKKGWRNCLRLVDPECGHSVTEARMSECRLKEPMPSGT